MRRFGFYHKETGLFHAHWFMTDVDRPAAIAANTPKDHIALEGDYDPLSQRVDIQTAKVIDYQPPCPSEHHEWSAQAKRWRLKAEVLELCAKRDAAHAEILRLERDVQPRAVREALLGRGGFDRLREIEEAIAALREDLTRCASLPAEVLLEARRSRGR